MKKFSVILLIAVLAMSCVFADTLETTATISGSIDAAYTIGLQEGSYHYTEPDAATSGAKLSIKFNTIKGGVAAVEDAISAEVGASLTWTPKAATALPKATEGTTGKAIKSDFSETGDFKLKLDSFKLKYKKLTWDLTKFTAVANLATNSFKDLIVTDTSAGVAYMGAAKALASADGYSLPAATDKGTTLTWGDEKDYYTFTAVVEGDGLKKDASKTFYTGVQTPKYELTDDGKFTIKGAASFGYKKVVENKVTTAAVAEAKAKKDVTHDAVYADTYVFVDMDKYEERKDVNETDEQEFTIQEFIYNRRNNATYVKHVIDDEPYVEIILDKLYLCPECGEFVGKDGVALHDDQVESLLEDYDNWEVKLATNQTASSYVAPVTEVKSDVATTDYFVAAGSLELAYASAEKDPNIAVKVATDQSIAFGKAFPTAVNAKFARENDKKVRYDADASLELTLKPATLKVYYAKKAVAAYATDKYDGIKNLLDASIVVDIKKFTPDVKATFEAKNILHLSRVFNTRLDIALDADAYYNIYAYANDILTNKQNAEALKAAKDRYFFANFVGQKLGVGTDLTFGDVNVTAEVGYGIVLKEFSYNLGATYVNENFTVEAGVDNVYYFGTPAKETACLTVNAGIESATVVKNATVGFSYASDNLISKTFVDQKALFFGLDSEAAEDYADFGAGTAKFYVSVKF